MALESLTQNANIRDVNPTTKRLVERCLTGEWCVQLRKSSFDKDALNFQSSFRQGSPSHDILASTSPTGLQFQTAISTSFERPHDNSAPLQAKSKQLKPSRSVENLKSHSTKPPPSRSVDGVRRPSKESTTSFGVVASTTTNTTKSREKPESMDDGSLLQQAAKPPKHYPHLSPPPTPSSLAPIISSVTKKARRPPPAPPKRRKAPPVPFGQTHGGPVITTIASSSLSAHSELRK